MESKLFLKAVQVFPEMISSKYDLVLTSNAPIYFSEIVRVLKPEGVFIAAFSYGGSAVIEMSGNISQLLAPYGLNLLEIKNEGNNSLVLCENKKE